MMKFEWLNLFRNQTDNQISAFELLKKVPLFSDLDNRELKEFLRISHTRNYSSNESIFWEGEPGAGMYIIQKGRVRIAKQCKDETEGTILAELRDGDFFGELALLNDSPRSACAIAAEDTSVIGIFRPDLLSLLKRKPALGNKVLFRLADMIGHRLKATNQELKRVQEELASRETA